MNALIVQNTSKNFLLTTQPPPPSPTPDDSAS